MNRQIRKVNHKPNEVEHTDNMVLITCLYAILSTFLSLGQHTATVLTHRPSDYKHEL